VQEYLYGSASVLCHKHIAYLIIIQKYCALIGAIHYRYLTSLVIIKFPTLALRVFLLYSSLLRGEGGKVLMTCECCVSTFSPVEWIKSQNTNHFLLPVVVLKSWSFSVSYNQLTQHGGEATFCRGRNTSGGSHAILPT